MRDLTAVHTIAVGASRGFARAIATRPVAGRARVATAHGAAAQSESSHPGNGSTGSPKKDMKPDHAARQATTALGSDADRLSRRARAVLIILCAAVFLDGADVSMTGVALPSIRADLGMSTSSLQWVVSAYVLGFGGFLLLGGRAADLFGRRRMFLISLGVFVAASGLGPL